MSKYREPIGFNGSNGRWWVKKEKGYFPSIMLGPRSKNANDWTRPRLIVNETVTRKGETFEATAHMMAASKEMAKALQSVAHLFHKDDEGKLMIRWYSDEELKDFAKEIEKSLSLAIPKE